MSERMTSINPINGTPGMGEGLSIHGRENRQTMIEKFREHYRHKLDEAQRMLALTDEQLIVTTYVGVWTRRGITEVHD